MDNWAKPASTALMPMLDERGGPTVPPERESLRIWKTWSLEPDLSAMAWSKAVLTLSVVK